MNQQVKPNYGVTFRHPPGFKVLLEGQTGTGKTYSLRSLIDCGLTPFIISTEPGIHTVLGDLPEDKCHWRYIPPAATSWDQLITNARTINTSTHKQLANMGDMDKRKYGQFMELLSTCANFTCDRTGESYGSCDSWGTDRVLVFDSLSGINLMAMDLVVGAKPVKSQSDWGIAMDNLEKLINRITCGIPCHVVMTAHLEREKDEVTGAIKNMTSTLGQKLAPRVPHFFDDVIMAKRAGAEWWWSTADSSTDLKSRHLEISDKIEPNFKLILDKWISMGNEITPTQVPATEEQS